MSDLVQKLRNPQDVEVLIRPAATPDSFRSALERGFVFVRFPNTKGGTDLGVKVDPDANAWRSADFANASGEVQISGTLALDYVKVRFRGSIDISKMKGTGCLEPVIEA